MGRQLPTKEQIEAITDPDALADLRDDLEREIAKIEVDLEFRPGDEDWAARARGALVAHNICFGQVSRTLYRLSRPAKASGGGKSAEQTLAKATRQQAAAAKVAAQASGRIADAEAKKADAHARAVALLERTSWLGHFHTAAVKQLSEAQMQSLTEAATGACVRQMKAALSQPGTTPPSSAHVGPQPLSEGEKPNG